MSPRVYARRFDWDEARRLRAEGLTYKRIADMLGVSQTAVRLACNPRRYALNRAYSAEYQRGGRCIDCGAPISRNVSRPVSRCRECRRHAAATSVRPTKLYCSACQTWKHDNAFPYSRDKKSEIRRGRHKSCRECNTRLRQEYRQRRKQPCVDCGAPALPPNEKASGGASVPRCRACFHVWQAEWQRQPEQRDAARRRALERTKASA